MASRETLLNSIHNYLEKQGLWHMSGDEGFPRGFFGGQDVQCHWDMHLIGGENGILTFLARCPVKVPVDRRTAAALYLAESNWRINFGNFEMNSEDGEVLFRTSVPVTRGTVSTKALMDLVHAPMALTDCYLPGLFKVVWSGQEPAPATGGELPNDAPDTGERPTNGASKPPTNGARLTQLFGREGKASE